MKTKKQIQFFLFIIIIFIGACNTTEKQENSDDSSQVKTDDTTIATDDNSASIYQLEGDWKDQNNKTLQLKELKGKIHVVAMVFTNCAYACPKLVGNIQEIESKLTIEDKKNVDFILVSFDVERDTPERLLAFSKEMSLTDNWILLHGNEEQTHELALVLGVKYDKQTDGSFSHSNIISVLDREGNITFQQEGLEVPTEKTVEMIKAEIK
ncbi:MAG: SCO family protein [Bacteroidia bacterium]|nr:SCO family protein [Bacteroidia bacterium]